MLIQAYRRNSRLLVHVTRCQFHVPPCCFSPGGPQKRAQIWGACNSPLGVLGMPNLRHRVAAAPIIGLGFFLAYEIINIASSGTMQPRKVIKSFKFPALCLHWRFRRTWRPISHTQHGESMSLRKNNIHIQYYKISQPNTYSHMRWTISYICAYNRFLWCHITQTRRIYLTCFTIGHKSLHQHWGPQLDCSSLICISSWNKEQGFERVHLITGPLAAECLFSWPI